MFALVGRQMNQRLSICQTEDARIMFVLAVTCSCKVWVFRWSYHGLDWQIWPAACMRHHCSFDILTMCSKFTVTGDFLGFYSLMCLTDVQR